MNLLAWVVLISCWEFERVAFLLLQPNTNCSIKNVTLHKKYFLSAKSCWDSGQPQVIDLLFEWCVAYSRMSKSHICCRPGLNHSHLPQAQPLHSKMWFNLSDVKATGVALCYCSVLYIRLVVLQLQTLNGVPQECVVAARPRPTKHTGFETHLHVQPLLH